MIKKYHLLFALLILFSSCASDREEHSAETASQTRQSPAEADHRSNLNVSILIDLSDRIDPLKNPNATMPYFQRDTGYIAAIVHAFNQHVISKKLLLINDRIQTFIDPLPQNPQVVENLAALKVELTKDNVTRDLLENLSTEYTSNATKLYTDAIDDKAYVGSDTWRFFKSNVKDYCIKKDAHNVLIILTDGYMFHENSRITEGNRSNQINKTTFTKLGLHTSNWKATMQEKNLGFPTATSGLENLKVLVLGLNPSAHNPFEEDVLKAYWEQWLGEMGVKQIMVKKADLPVNLEESIQTFILSP